MDQEHYKEMLDVLSQLEQDGALIDKRIYLFGHCDATENLATVLLERGYRPIAILDNNVAKQGNQYKGIPIEAPEQIIGESGDESLVCIVARAYAAMSTQLRELGYSGPIRKLVDYNSFAEYSLSEETMMRMRDREKRGEIKLWDFSNRHPGAMMFLCPFSALGDIYIMMSYLPAYLKKIGREKSVIGVVGKVCAQVVKLFGGYEVESFSQQQMDEMIQAGIYTQNPDVFIPHQDRPYVVDLHKALYIKKIPLEKIYCCGVFGLPKDTPKAQPECFEIYPGLAQIPKGKSVILSPYAKSVTALPQELWHRIIVRYQSRGFACFTNVVGNEIPLEGTQPISPEICQIQSVVEHAGTFIGIRSGLCDVLQSAKAKKIALYPDYNYCDTQWKAIDIYMLDGWENRIITQEVI